MDSGSESTSSSEFSYISSGDYDKSAFLSRDLRDRAVGEQMALSEAEAPRNELRRGFVTDQTKLFISAFTQLVPSPYNSGLEFPVSRLQELVRRETGMSIQICGQTATLRVESSRSSMPDLILMIKIQNEVSYVEILHAVQECYNFHWVPDRKMNVKLKNFLFRILREVKPMSTNEFLSMSDYLAMRHLRGPVIIDCHGGSAAQNLAIFALKIFRQKVALNRGEYNGPFGSYENVANRFRQFQSVRVNVGDLTNVSHSHASNDLLVSALTLFGFQEGEHYYRDVFDSEMICDLQKFSLQESAALCLFAQEYLAFRQNKPCFQSAELRIAIGHAGLDWYQEQGIGSDNSELCDGQVDRLHFLISQLQNGPLLTSFGMNLPAWSHFSQVSLYSTGTLRPILGFRRYDALFSRHSGGHSCCLTSVDS